MSRFAGQPRPRRRRPWNALSAARGPGLEKGSQRTHVRTGHGWARGIFGRVVFGADPASCSLARCGLEARTRERAPSGPETPNHRVPAAKHGRGETPNQAQAQGQAWGSVARSRSRRLPCAAAAPCLLLPAGDAAVLRVGGPRDSLPLDGASFVPRLRQLGPRRSGGTLAGRGAEG